MLQLGHAAREQTVVLHGRLLNWCGAAAPVFSEDDLARLSPLERTRNIGIMAHIDAGKTTT
ncbi:MAG: hypothetical protein O7C73_05290, partial [Nitrospirae bacterium]|nr:hypothetical protein [Nitrospirota bacterium]